MSGYDPMLAAAVSISPTFASVADLVRIPANETWVAKATWDRASAERRARALFEPHLTHRDDREELLAALSPVLLYAPFWRVKLAVGGLHAAPSAKKTIDIANIAFPMPMPSAFGRAGVLMVSARSAIPHSPGLPSFFGGEGVLEIARGDLVPLTNETARAAVAEGEVVDADVDCARGERLATESLVELLRGPSARRLELLPRVESTMFVLHPLWLARCGEECFLLLSGRDGKVASARYPRPPTLSERVRRFFTA